MIVPSDSLRAFLVKASKKYNQQLNKDAVEYLRGRGIDKEAAEKFRLGYVADPEPGHESFIGWLAIPYLTPSGSVVSIRFRTIPPAEKKYLPMTGDTPRIYNTKALELSSRSICVTEGEFDCMIAELSGLPCVGIPGATHWKPIYARLMSHYEAVYVLSDDDNPGSEEKNSGQDFPKTLAKDLPNVRNIPMTCNGAKGDVNKFVLEFGPDALRKKVGISR